MAALYLAIHIQQQTYSLHPSNQTMADFHGPHRRQKRDRQANRKKSKAGVVEPGKVLTKTERQQRDSVISTSESLDKILRERIEALGDQYIVDEPINWPPPGIKWRFDWLWNWIPSFRRRPSTVRSRLRPRPYYLPDPEERFLLQQMKSLLIFVIALLLVFGVLYTGAEYLLKITRVSAFLVPSTIFVPIAATASSCPVSPFTTTITHTETITHVVSPVASNGTFSLTTSGMSSAGQQPYLSSIDSAGSTRDLSHSTASLENALTRSTSTVNIESTSTLMQTLTVPAYTSTTFSVLSSTSIRISTSTHTISVYRVSQSGAAGNQSVSTHGTISSTPGNKNGSVHTADRGVHLIAGNASTSTNVVYVTTTVKMACPNPLSLQSPVMRVFETTITALPMTLTESWMVPKASVSSEGSSSAQSTMASSLTHASMANSTVSSVVGFNSSSSGGHTANMNGTAASFDQSLSAGVTPGATGTGTVFDPSISSAAMASTKSTGTSYDPAIAKTFSPGTEGVYGGTSYLHTIGGSLPSFSGLIHVTPTLQTATSSSGSSSGALSSTINSAATNTGQATSSSFDPALSTAAHGPSASVSASAASSVSMSVYDPGMSSTSETSPASESSATATSVASPSNYGPGVSSVTHGPPATVSSTASSTANATSTTSAFDPALSSETQGMTGAVSALPVSPSSASSYDPGASAATSGASALTSESSTSSGATSAFDPGSAATTYGPSSNTSSTTSSSMSLSSSSSSMVSAGGSPPVPYLSPNSTSALRTGISGISGARTGRSNVTTAFMVSSSAVHSSIITGAGVASANMSSSLSKAHSSSTSCS